MRIHRLELSNVRGIEHLVLDELPETGVVVIHGENEAGKSTIVEALDVVLTPKNTVADPSAFVPCNRWARTWPRKSRLNLA